MRPNNGRDNDHWFLQSSNMTILMIVDRMPCKISGCISMTFRNISLSGFTFRRIFFAGNAFEKHKRDLHTLFNQNFKCWAHTFDRQLLEYVRNNIVQNGTASSTNGCIWGKSKNKVEHSREKCLKSEQAHTKTHIHTSIDYRFWVSTWIKIKMKIIENRAQIEMSRMWGLVGGGK